jgi:hypothetical protein
MATAHVKQEAAMHDDVSFIRSSLVARVCPGSTDVIANVGQFGRWLRNHGYTGRIISFEPISEVYRLLVQEVRGDVLWETKNVAIGDRCGTATINVGSNSALSSFLSVSEVVPSDLRQRRIRREGMRREEMVFSAPAPARATFLITSKSVKYRKRRSRNSKPLSISLSTLATSQTRTEAFSVPT